MKFFLKKVNKINKAFTLVETLVAVSIFSISLLGLMSILASSISNTTYAKEKNTANYLAQEGIEYLRNMRDTYVLYNPVSAQNGWDSFRTGMTPCGNGVGTECGFNVNILPHSVFYCSGDGIQCKLYVNNGNYNDSSLSGIYSGFTRKVWISTISLNEVRIFSKVEWKQGSGTYSTTFSEDLFNWVE
jgi:type II secretory pathway pseudopilin PulG